MSSHNSASHEPGILLLSVYELYVLVSVIWQLKVMGVGGQAEFEELHSEFLCVTVS